jgi:hypothetical protein
VAALTPTWAIGTRPSHAAVAGRVIAAERQPVRVLHRPLIEDPSNDAVVLAMTPQEVSVEGARVPRARRGARRSRSARVGGGGRAREDGRSGAAHP